MTIQRAPIGLTELPCYSNNEKDRIYMSFTFAEALKKLKLYKYDNENLTDISSLIGKWKACDRINISNNKVRAAFFISNTRKNILTFTTIADFHTSRSTEHTDRTVRFQHCKQHGKFPFPTISIQFRGKSRLNTRAAVTTCTTTTNTHFDPNLDPPSFYGIFSIHFPN